MAVLLMGNPARSVPDRTATFLSRAWAVTSDPAKVDRSVMQALLDFFPSDKRLASPKDPFDATDVVSGRPTRRFLLAGEAQSCWFVAYEHGGRGHHIHLVVFDTSPSKPSVQFAATGSAGVHDDIAGWQVLRAAVTGRQLRELISDEF